MRKQKISYLKISLANKPYNKWQQKMRKNQLLLLSCNFLWKMSSLLQLNGNKVFYKQVNQSNHVTKRVTVVTLWSPAKKDRPIALRLFNRKEEVIKQVIPKTLAFLQKNEQTLRYYDVIINAKERSFMYSRLHKVGSIKEWLISKLVNYVWIMHFSETYPLLRGFLDHSPMLDSRELR